MIKIFENFIDINCVNVVQSNSYNIISFLYYDY